MEKVDITISVDKTWVKALDIYLKMENTTLKKQLSDDVAALYEKKVPKEVQTFIENLEKMSSHGRHTPRAHTPEPAAAQPDVEPVAAPRRDVRENTEEGGE